MTEPHASSVTNYFLNGNKCNKKNRRNNFGGTQFLALYCDFNYV